MIPQKTLAYVLHFLLGSDLTEQQLMRVGYTAKKEDFENHDIVIVPSGFFEKDYGNASSMPSLPLKELDGLPFLFGDSRIEYVGKTLVVYADFVASAYFLISRYEEILFPENRDIHGRYIGRKSLLGRAELLHRPLIDEYRMWLRNKLRLYNTELPHLKKNFSKIYLTHDVDVPAISRSWRGVFSAIYHRQLGVLDAFRLKFSPLEKNPLYTFPYLFDLNKEVPSSHTIIFIRSGGKTDFDKPYYKVKSKDIQLLIQLAKDRGVEIGLHSSYQSAEDLRLVILEKILLEEASKTNVSKIRCHFLRAINPEDFEYFYQAAITDDFTMSYADVAGFRLGTSHPVHFINPHNGIIYPLLLHPLTIMDVTLEKYMNFSYEEALSYSLQLIENVRNVGGELVLLFHNDHFAEQSSYLKKLYETLIERLK